MRRLPGLLLFTAALSSFAQTQPVDPSAQAQDPSPSPESEWAPPPVAPQAPAPAPEQPREPLTSPPPLPAPTPIAPLQAPSAPTGTLSRRRLPEAPNTLSMLGATTLGQWNRGQAFIIGWPLLTVRASLGLSDSFDLGLGFDSYYGAMNEFRGTARVKVASREGWAFAVVAEAGGALFGSSAQREQRGPRWITGRRNWNVVPGFVASYQGAGPRAPRLFIDTRYMLAVDLEPYSTDPLSGVPPNIIFGHNVLLRVGAEVPLSVKTSFLFELGMDIHGRDIDSVVMPFASLGIVAGL